MRAHFLSLSPYYFTFRMLKRTQSQRMIDQCRLHHSKNSNVARTFTLTQRDAHAHTTAKAVRHHEQKKKERILVEGYARVPESTATLHSG
jgi:hypothetical protein